MVSSFKERVGEQTGQSRTLIDPSLEAGLPGSLVEDLDFSGTSIAGVSEMSPCNCATRGDLQIACGKLAATIGVSAASFFPPALRGVFNFLLLTSTCEAVLAVVVEGSVVVAPTVLLTEVGSATAMEALGPTGDGSDLLSRVVPLFPFAGAAGALITDSSIMEFSIPSLPAADTLKRSSSGMLSPWRHLASSASALLRAAFSFSHSVFFSSYLFFHSSAVNSSFTWTTFFIVLALWPNISVDFVSVSLKDAGEQQIMIVVLAFPPNDSWRIRVNFKSR